ncbi:MAG: hypothetical protein ABSC56_11190 [Solirubrobacteraceae bacterium]|jgi:hypothetical protein
MSFATNAGTLLRRTREIWPELDYAQQRLLDFRTGDGAVADLKARLRFDPPAAGIPAAARIQQP